MNNEEPDRPPSIVENHRYLILVFGSIIISIGLVFVALALYVSSGAAQLDLSRPGYAGIREQAKDDGTFKGFDSDGPLDKAALNQFETLYSEKLKEAQEVDAYSGDVLSPKSLQIDQKSALKSE